MTLWVPDGGHGAALHNEEEDLGEMAGGDEGDDDPQGYCEAGLCSVDDAEDAEAEAYFRQTDADYVEDLPEDAVFETERDLSRVKAVDMLTEAILDEESTENDADGPNELD